MGKFSEREVWMLIIIMALVIFSAWVIDKWRSERKKHKADVLSYQMRTNEIFTNVHLKFDDLIEHADKIVKLGDQLSERKNQLYISGRSHYIVCLISDAIEYALYDYVWDLRLAYEKDFEYRNRIQSVLKLFVFIPILDTKDLSKSMISASFSKSSDKPYRGCGWFAKIWGIEIDDSSDKAATHNLHSIPLLVPPYLHNNPTELPIATEIGEKATYYTIPCSDILYEDYHIFESIDELIEFVEELAKDDRYLLNIYNSYAVTETNFIKSNLSFTFDPQWLASHNSQNA